MARLAWDAVQTARAYMQHTGRVDEHLPLEQRRLPTTPFTGLWLPVPHADSAAFLAAMLHTPVTLVPTRPRGLPVRPTCAHRVTHFGTAHPGSEPEHPDYLSPPSQLKYEYHVSFALAPE